MLTSLECDYLENYFFSVMTEFLRCICYHLDFTQKWDDLLWIHYKNVELDELDSEDLCPPQIEISHFLMLFIFDFSFTFISNFTSIDNNCKLITKFSDFYGFFNYAVSILATVNHNFFNAYKISDIKKKIIEANCEKTEYTIKDTFNHYGVSLILYLIFKGELKYVDLKTKRELSAFPLPLCINPNSLIEIQESILFIMLKFENSAEINFFKDYKLICFDLLQMVIKHSFGSDNADKVIFDSNSVLLQVLHEFIICHDKFSKEQNDYISNILSRNESNSMLSLVTASNTLDHLKKVIHTITSLDVKYQNVNAKIVEALLDKLCFNSFLLNEYVLSFVRKVNNGQFNETIERVLNELSDKNK